MRVGEGSPGDCLFGEVRDCKSKDWLVDEVAVLTTGEAREAW